MKQYQPVSATRSPRSIPGSVGVVSGRMAEHAVIAHYRQRGMTHLATRWRGNWGEIDLIFRDGKTVVFIEVKKSTDHEKAALRLSRRQMDRICMSALEFLAVLPGGQTSAMRFDAALLDETGRIEVIEGAFGEN